ncbi:MAG TPA: helix-turn-helix transcriptional regulator [Rhizobacter sp.]|nr:helix-turn-helix transcriptional regulator [Rhizobacter sp.]
MHTALASSPPPVGALLREWRQRRRLSQLDLALDADISTRHLSYMENGRATPSRAMVLHLAEQLEVPLRERNTLLAAAGYAPLYPERKLDDPALQAARATVEQLLKAHEPHPALAVDRHWNMLAHNPSLLLLMQGIPPELLQPPVNVLRLSLHPQGVAPKIVNLLAWRDHLFERLRHQITVSADPVLAALLKELQGYPVPADAEQHEPIAGNAVAVPLKIRSSVGVLSFLSTTTVFGTPIDITLSELALETFFPADEFTTQALRHLSDGQKAAQQP